MKMIAAALDVKPCEICGCCDEKKTNRRILRTIRNHDDEYG